MSLVDRIFAPEHGRTLALVEDAAPGAPGAAVTYEELARLVEETARVLRASGVAEARDGVARVGLACPNGVAYVALALGVLRAGGCVVPIPGELAGRERHALLRAVRPRAVLVGAGAPWDGEAELAAAPAIEVAGTPVRVLAAPAWSTNGAAGDAAPRGCTNVAPRGAAGPGGGNGASLDASPLRGANGGPPEAAPFDEARLAALDPAFIRFSSGTTGASKGVVLSHQTLLERIAAANRGLEIDAGDRVAWLLPMAHHFPASILLYLAHGATTVLLRSHLAADVLAAAARHRPTVFYAAPFHYAVLAADRSRAGWDSLRLAVSTAAPLSPKTAQAFAKRFGVPITQALGIIEAGLVAVNQNPGERPESVGRPLPDFAVELRDEGGAPVAPGEVGELFLRGPGLLDAYLWPFRTRDEILVGGWFGTGDLAAAAPDGSLELVGRTRSVINVAGLKCFPEEIESVLREHAGVRDVRVVGRPHPQLGAVPVAEIVPRDATRPPSAQNLAAHCRAALARYKVPLEYRLVDSLPRTASGKVRR